MKYSGVEWIGNVPDSWEIRKVKQCFYISKEQANQNNPTVLSLARSGVKVRDISNNEGQLAASYDNYNVVKPGDLLLNPMDLYSGANCSLSNVNGVISPAYVNLRKSTELEAKFFDYYFKTQYWTMAMFAHGKGVSFDNRWTLNSEGLMNYKVPFPNLDVQKSIVNILNTEAQKIDALIDIENKQIQKLKDYKSSLIYKTVFSGICFKKSVENKVLYLPPVNVNFALAPIGSLFKIKKDIIGHNTDKVLSITQNGIVKKDISSNEGQMAESYDNYQIVNVGDFAMNHMDLLTGWIDISKFEGVTSPDYRVFELKNPSMVSKYFLYVFQSYYTYKIFYGFGQGVSFYGRWRLPAQNFNKILIPVPSIEEQKNIVDYLDSKCAQINGVIELKTKKVAILENYRKSLFFEYITGKKEVAA